MRAWDQPSIPSLPGQAPLPTVFDTAAGGRVTLEREEKAGLYVCGITPYDATHMGHASTYVAFDVLNRAWRDAGIPVTFVQNVTDVDDPLLERAEATGVDWQVLAQEQTDLFRTDMVALNVIAPDHYVSVVDSVPEVADAVARLLEAGVAYRVPGFTAEDGTVHPEGDIYFDLEAAEAAGAGKPGAWKLGQVAHYSLDEMLTIFGERGGDPDRPGKRNPLDPLLWRVERPGEPAWEAGELGRGRPGWHIECSVISSQYLGAPFSVQGGGSDLIFPHHDLGSSHSYALNGQPMARHFMHTGMVGLDGEKMSKSLGNLVLVSKLRAEGVEPAAIRLAIMDNHYRTDWFWEDSLLQKAKGRLELYRSAVAAAPGEADDRALALVNTVREQLADDLNTPAALVSIDQWALSTLENGGAGGQLVADLLMARLGISLS
ncbi:cysteine--1-D-myo-inosityl 2-amino-2-deoxy-alpha-D-glucopyranoside ligase [Rothia nasimurium]|uniref:cysteine--1-D-myo-inosityl 2-amino-2-deoxy-alpha-D-glucopyranoside ligase n=1 Tax=Rothia nasimurium TaxID=85336 RepID=UPI001EFF97DE|nr:cysteine--1-D-myo-inosityl 2-amino-2-deoxy-alpha-D-glucopyranoside ligase [Rothia nasimurium]